MPESLEIRYFGWSGVALLGAGGTVTVDLFGDTARLDTLPPATTVLCLTHGHPEHCGSTRALLGAARPEQLARTHLLSSPPVVRHVARGGLLAPERIHALGAGEDIEIEALRISTFAWRHLPLLPPESMRAKGEYAASLLRHPLEALRIGLAGVRLPMRAPYLGFHVTFADGQTVLNYSEGLHRLTDAREVDTVARQLWARTLLLAVEPEDVVAIPWWLERLNPEQVVIYEAHRPWRELFGLPHVELDEYAAELRTRLPETQVATLTEPGQRLTIQAPGASRT